MSMQPMSRSSWNRSRILTSGRPTGITRISQRKKVHDIATRVGIYIWLTLPPGMDPDQAVAEVRTSVAFGRAEVRLQYVEEGAPDSGETKHTCGQCAPGYGHNNPTYGPSDLHDGP